MIYTHQSTKPFSCVFGMVIVIAIMAISSGCKLIENLHPELAMRGAEFPGSHECGECHVDIYKEWAGSLHSKSYTSEEFRESTNNYEFKFCIRCHVPETIFTSLEVDSDKTAPSLSKSKNAEIAPREYNLADGVDCHGCHLTMDCTLAGPHAGISPHPIEKNVELFKRSELCGKCHVDTFEEYLMYVDKGNDETCQDCHMPAVNRKLIKGEPWQKLHVKKEGKAHTFSIISALESNKDFIELTFTELDSNNKQIKGNVEILNSKVNHSIPTGKYGYREVLLLVNLKDNFGRIVKSKQESMFVEMKTQLKPGEKKIYSFEFDIDSENGVKDLEAVLFRTNFDRTKQTLLAKVELELELP
ncbi:MAG: hypothetical protein MAG551_00500 [Candidatus Scalindua arabica]|uniref:Cytochrome c-552/4 domain-containing protein n=1 Tax=Candidatus Scalindua arabica TaxID=1127984 RepID=A0A941W2P1_9BACT|nr:hypothetical protein [Candidatus Scalindua arabica]